MQRLIEDSRRLREQHDQLTAEYEKLKREFDSLIGEKPRLSVTVSRKTREHPDRLQRSRYGDQ
jgi:predicted nuclease with TOPRIM domain